VDYKSIAPMVFNKWVGNPPIEKFWANIERWIRNRIAEIRQLHDAIINSSAYANST
jgi:hypothetical protein